jgi:serine/threonine protein kinase
MNYTPIKVLGKGTFGEVILAKDADNRFTAVKKLDKLTCRRETAAREISNMVKVNGIKGTSQLIEHCEDDKNWYLIFDYIKGVDMLSFLLQRNSPLEEDITRYIFHQVLLTMAQVHAVGLVHHDIVLSN